MSIAFDPPFSPQHAYLLAACGVASMAALQWRAWRRAPTPRATLLAALRVLLALGLALLLLNPVRSTAGTGTAKRPLLVLVDTSRSMAVRDAGARSRFQAAKAAAVENRTLLAALAAHHDVRFCGFAGAPTALTAAALHAQPAPTGERTDLAAALTGAVSAAQAPGAVLLVSDGADSGDGFPLDAARAARNRGFAVYTLCLGRETAERDLQVVARRSQLYGAPGQSLAIAAELRLTGAPRADVRVHLSIDGHRVASRTVDVTSGRPVTATFPHVFDRKGLYRCAIDADTLPGEANPANNRASVLVNVLEGRVRVLFLEGRPSWDTKFVAQALRADPAVALDVIYKLTDSKYFAVLGGAESEPGIAVPKTPDEMARYDVILFGKGFEEFYNEADARALRTWVQERGGNVVFVRGRADLNTPTLRELEPVTWSDQQIAELRLRLTAEGRSHPGFAFGNAEDAQTVVHRLPPLISATRVEGEKALAVVLARAEGAADDRDAREMATVVYQRSGQGKVMVIAGQGLWRWAFLPPDLAAYSAVHNEFWSQTVRWLVSESDFLPCQLVSLRTDRSVYGPNEPVRLLGYARAGAAGRLPAIAVTGPGGATEQVASARGDGRLADFQATYRPRTPGEYTAVIAAEAGRGAPVACTFMVAPGREEDLHRSARPDLMRQIAEMGGGAALSERDLARLPERLESAAPRTTQPAAPATLWDRPGYLLLLVSLAALDWWLRRHGESGTA